MSVKPCRKRLARLSAYLDRELPPSVCEEIRRHMARCADCRVVLKTLRRAIALCRHAPGSRTPRPAVARVLAAIRREAACRPRGG